jgi:hypothetical protein
MHAIVTRMSDDVTPEDESGRKIRHLEPIDSQLAYLYRVAQDADGFRMSVTLDVHGIVISGDLVGRNEWFDLLADTLPKDPGGKALGESLSELGKFSPEQIAADDDYFIHLIDVHRATGSDARSADVPKLLWRGRVGSVDGWSVGYVSQSS